MKITDIFNSYFKDMEEKHKRRVIMKLFSDYPAEFKVEFKKITSNEKKKIANDVRQMIPYLSKEIFLEFISDDNYKWNVYTAWQWAVGNEIDEEVIKRVLEIIDGTPIHQRFYFMKICDDDRFIYQYKAHPAEIAILNMPYGTPIDYLDWYINKTNDTKIWTELEGLPTMQIGMILDSVNHIKNKNKIIKTYGENLRNLRDVMNKKIINDPEVTTRKVPYFLEEIDEDSTDFKHILEEKLILDFPSSPLLKSARNINSNFEYSPLNYQDETIQSVYIFVNQIAMFLTRQKSNGPFSKSDNISVEIFEYMTNAVKQYKEAKYGASLDLLQYMTYKISEKYNIDRFDELKQVKSDKDIIDEFILKINELNPQIRTLNDVILSNHPQAFNARNNIAHYISNLHISSSGIIYLCYRISLIM